MFKFYVLCYVLFASSPWKTLAFLSFDSKESESSDPVESNGGEKQCPVTVLAGVDWVLNVRQRDYGWREDTHRAVIALVVSGWETFTSESERILMEQQLEVEITRSLLRNSSFPVYPNNLALYINALVAINRNPRNFHNIDLVALLIDLIHSSSHTTHPFILLALCNAKSLEQYHLDILEYYLKNHHSSRQSMEYKALALQAYECAGTLNLSFKLNESLVYETRKLLVSQQYPDGSFGNVYSTALIVQALASAPSYFKWNKEGALNYLRKQALVEVNMVSTYLIQLALNCDRIRFLKDIHPKLKMDKAVLKKPEDFFIQYSLRVGLHPNVHHTITINVPSNSNFFEVMKLSAENDPKFNFSYYMDKNKEPSVYAISNVPNDAEENMYWRLCWQTEINHDRHSSRITTFQKSPIHMYPQTKDHMIYWYMDRECEETT